MRADMRSLLLSLASYRQKRPLHHSRSITYQYLFLSDKIRLGRSQVGEDMSLMRWKRICQGTMWQLAWRPAATIITNLEFRKLIRISFLGTTRKKSVCIIKTEARGLLSISLTTVINNFIHLLSASEKESSDN